MRWVFSKYADHYQVALCGLGCHGTVREVENALFAFLTVYAQRFDGTWHEKNNDITGFIGGYRAAVVSCLINHVPQRSAWGSKRLRSAASIRGAMAQEVYIYRT
jgi:hypothetical protein